MNDSDVNEISFHLKFPFYVKSCARKKKKLKKHEHITPDEHKIRYEKEGRTE